MWPSGQRKSLRSLCAFAKIGATVELAKTILEEEPAVVIFTNFAKAASAVHERLAGSGWEGVLLTGDTPPNKRQGLVDKFHASSGKYIVLWGIHSSPVRHTNSRMYRTGIRRNFWCWWCRYYVNSGVEFSRSG